MIIFKVWDPLNDVEAIAADIEADDPEMAAEIFAEADSEVTGTDAYTYAPHALHVRDPEGTLHEVRVLADVNLIFTGKKR